MDQNLLVDTGRALVQAMDDEGVSPRLAMWVHNADTDTWKLWIVPPKAMTDKREFYRKVSRIISDDKTTFGGIDASDTEMVLDDHPAMRGMKGFIRAEGLSNIAFSGNRFNGFYLPDGIILRSTL